LPASGKKQDIIFVKALQLYAATNLFACFIIPVDDIDESMV
jgi:hypothetical protein